MFQREHLGLGWGGSVQKSFHINVLNINYLSTSNFFYITGKLLDLTKDNSLLDNLYYFLVFSVRTTKLAFIDNVAKPPREVRRQQAKFGTSNVIMKGGDGKKKHFPAVDMISIGRAKQQMAERGNSRIIVVVNK